MSDITDQSLSEQLEAFGLNQTEAAIYLHLLVRPSKTILELARELDLPRTSVYDNALKLAEKGLVQKIVTFKSQRLKAYPLDILQATIDKERTRVEELQRQLTDLQANLTQNLLVPANTEARYYYGARGLQQMMWNALRADDGIVGYSQFGRIDVVGEKFTHRHGQEMIERGIKDRVISSMERVQKYVGIDTDNETRFKCQEIRVVDPGRLYISGDTSIYNSTFAVAYWQQGEVVGVEIENAELVKTQRTIFELVWEMAEPVAPEHFGVHPLTTEQT